MSRKNSRVSRRNSHVSRRNSFDKPILVDNSDELNIKNYHIKKCNSRKVYSCIKLKFGSGNNVKIDDNNFLIETFKIDDNNFLIETYVDTVKEFIFLRNRIKYCWYDKCRNERHIKFLKYIKNMFDKFTKLNNSNHEIKKYESDLCNIDIFKKSNLVAGDNFWKWTSTRAIEGGTNEDFDKFRRELVILQIDFLIFMIVDLTNILKNPKRLHEMKNS
jgi:hypothetical protein